MSPAMVYDEPSFTLAPIQKTPEQKYNYGAVITDLDLNDISGKLPFVNTELIRKMLMSRALAKQSGHTRLLLSETKRISLL
jgi:hypothetical protein